MAASSCGSSPTSPLWEQDLEGILHSWKYVGIIKQVQCAWLFRLLAKFGVRELWAKAISLGKDFSALE